MCPWLDAITSEAKKQKKKKNLKQTLLEEEPKLLVPKLQNQSFTVKAQAPALLCKKICSANHNKGISCYSSSIISSSSEVNRGPKIIPRDTKLSLQRKQLKGQLKCEISEKMQSLTKCYANLNARVTLDKANDGEVGFSSPLAIHTKKSQEVKSTLPVIKVHPKTLLLIRGLANWLKKRGMSLGSLEAELSSSISQTSSSIPAGTNQPMITHDTKDDLQLHSELHPQRLLQFREMLQEKFELLQIDKSASEEIEKWLKDISIKYPNIMEEPLFWECFSYVKGKHDDSFKENEPILNTTEDLKDNIHCLEIKGEQPYAKKIQRGKVLLDHSGVLNTSNIVFEVKHLTVDKNKYSECAKSLTVTPVRRSQRRNTMETPSCIRSLSILTPEQLEKMKFKPNPALLAMI